MSNLLTETENGEAVSESRPARHESLMTEAAEKALSVRPSRKYFTPAATLPEVPTTYKTAYELWRELRPAFLRSDLAPEWRKRIDEIRIASVALQQAPKEPEVDYMKAARERGEFIVNAEANRKKRLAFLKENITADIFDKLPVLPAPVRGADFCLFVSLEITSRPEIKEKIAALRRQLASYEATLLENFIYVSPEQRRQEHKLAMLSNPTHAIIDRVQGEMAAYANEKVFNPVASAKRGLLMVQYRDTVRPLEVELLSAALAIAKAHQAESVEIEKAFFESQEVPHEKTGVSKKYDRFVTELTAELERISKSHGGVAVAGGLGFGDGVLKNVFGIDTLTPADVAIANDTLPVTGSAAPTVSA